VGSKNVLIISEYPGDFYSLGAALDRAEDDRYHYITVNTRDQPVDALMDPSNDAVILAYTPETEYLLRLAQKKNLSLPIIVLVDAGSEAQVSKLKIAGATDHIVRGLISDDMLHRILDYTIALSHVTLQHEQVVKQQQIERSAQQAGEHLRSVEKTVGQSDGFQTTTAAPTPATAAAPIPESVNTPIPVLVAQTASKVIFELAPDTVEETVPLPAPAPAQKVPRAPISPWNVITLGLLIAIALVSTALFQQRLNSEARLSRLEASNDILAQQVSQIHSDLTMSALAPAPVPLNIETAEAVTKPTVELQQTTTLQAKPITRSNLESWFINLGTFSSISAAQRFADSLGPSSHQVDIQAADLAERRLYRVRLVNLASEELADTLARDYQLSLGGKQLWVGRQQSDVF
jgi:AmiR/NasT family two-component response regulator